MKRVALSTAWFFLVPIADLTMAQDGVRSAPEVRHEASPKKNPPRRAVPQNIERMPEPPAPLARPTAPVVVPPLPAVPQGPVPATSCDAGGCWGADGKRYN